MWPFRRRHTSRHALGAAVTAIPSARVQEAPAPAVVVPPPPPVVEAPVAVRETPVSVVEAPAPVQTRAPVEPPPAPVRVRGPRVELGFRDGSTAALAPGSEQAKALTDIASVLTQRD
ncbi:MAG: hypothetical protein JWO22_542 [Frankiales bacterium]|nr:hypothetical protein [Frankiales bacterium]